jgi:hypothetical protein
LYDDAQRDAAAAAEAKRLADLRNNEELPLVYLDVSIKGKPVGRIHFVLFTNESPRAGGVGCVGNVCEPTLQFSCAAREPTCSRKLPGGFAWQKQRISCEVQPTVTNVAVLPDNHDSLLIAC